MSAATVESVLSRAMSDSTFADQLFANPDQALAGFELTTEEATTFKGMARADFDTLLQGSPEERKSFSFHCAAGTHFKPGSGLNHNQIMLKLHN